MDRLKFTKMVATGNDFVVLDARSLILDTRFSTLAKKVCDRRLGIGSDGLLLIEKSRRADFRMRIFNPDGSEAEMCGNGLRCLALYALEKKITSSRMTIETKAGILSAKVRDGLVKINMTDPKDIKLGIDLAVGAEGIQCHFVNTGVPHIVYFAEEIDKIDVEKLGREIRYHKAFLPAGTNADFVQIKARNSLLMRTYERGVEAETLACGTGATASAIISSIIKGFASPVKVYTRGGVLNIYFKKADKKFTDVFLEGEARKVFTGSINPSTHPRPKGQGICSG